MATLATLTIKLRADAGHLGRDLDAAASRVQQFTRGVQGIGKLAIGGALAGLGTAAAGVGLVMKSTVPLAKEFEAQLADLSIAASSSGLGLDSLHDAALRVGGDTSLLGVSATGAADAMTRLYKAGLSTTEIFGDLGGYMAGTAELGGALRAAIDMAAASELNMVQASDLAAVALATFGSELETAEERASFANMALDNMVRAADASVADVSDLAAALENIGPTAAAMGIGIGDVNNALAILSTRGIGGSEAGTALRAMLTNLNRQTPQVTGALEELGVSLYNAEGAFVGMPGIIEQMQRSMAGLTQEQRNQYVQTIAGTYGMNALNTLLEEGVDGWNAMAEATANAAGIQEQAITKANTLEGVMEALGGVVETLRIGIGEAFIPVLKALGKIFSGVVEKIGPPVIAFFKRFGDVLNSLVGYFDIVLKEGDYLNDWLTHMPEAIRPVVQGIGHFISALQGGAKPIQALIMALEGAGFSGVAAAIEVIATQVQQIWGAVEPYIQMAWEWIESHVELKDVLIALGIAVASVVLPALWGLVTAVAAVAWPFLALIAVVALLRNAWENNWGGIQDKLKAFWLTAQPILQKLWSWLQTHIPMAIQTLVTFWQTILQPTLLNFWTWMSTYLMPLFQTLWGLLAEYLPMALQILSDIWTDTLMPAIEAVWAWMKEIVVPFWKAFATLLIAVVGKNVEALAALWKNVLKPALETVWKFVKEKLQPVWEALEAFIQDPLKPTLIWLEDFLRSKVLAVFKKIKNFIQDVIEKMYELAEAIKDLELPGFLQRKSPSEIELSLMGTAEQLKELAQRRLPQFKTQLRLLPDPTPALTAAVPVGGRGGYGQGEVHFHFLDTTLDEGQLERALERYEYLYG